MGLSLYIPAPSCHAGDYDAEGEEWWVVLVVLPFAGLLVKGELGDLRQVGHGWLRHWEAVWWSLWGTPPASGVRLASNRCAPRAAALQGWQIEFYSSSSSSSSAVAFSSEKSF